MRSYLNEKSSGSRSRKQRLTAVGTRCTDHVTPLYPQNLALTSPTGGSPSVGIVRVRTKATEFSLLLLLFYCMHRNYCCLQEAISFRLLEIYYSGKCVGGGLQTEQCWPSRHTLLKGVFAVAPFLCNTWILFAIPLCVVTLYTCVGLEPLKIQWSLYVL